MWPTTTPSPAPVSAALARPLPPSSGFCEKIGFERGKGWCGGGGGRGGRNHWGSIYTLVHVYGCPAAHHQQEIPGKWRDGDGGGVFPFFFSLNIVTVQIASESERWTERESDGQSE